MRSRTGHHFDLGEAISMEDAISMLTIVFVLFVIFLVPLVSIDKAHLNAKQEDLFWSKVVSFLNEKSAALYSDVSGRYVTAFDLEQPLCVSTSRVTESGRQFVFVEHVAAADSSLTVIKHDIQSNTFSAMYLEKNAVAVKYQYGELQKIGSEWFFESNQTKLDFGNDERSKKLKESYRSWCVKRMEGLL